MRRAVVKLGGSTAYDPERRLWIAALAGAALPLVLVPGGGPFANLVREAQPRMGFSDRAAHDMAILAMDQFGCALADAEERLVAACSLAGIEAALAGGRIPVWLPSELAIPAPDIRASWDITSDALAAWLAGRVGADALLLVKQTRAFGAGGTLADLVAAGVVDRGLQSMLPPGVALFLAHPGDAAGAAALLAAGRLPGTPVAAPSPLPRAAAAE